MKNYNISANLIQVIKNLYDKATSAVLFKSSIGDWFQATVGVQQGCLLSPTLFNIFLEVERIIAEEQAGFRAGRSTTEQLLNLQILCEKYLQHQQDLYHVFIDSTMSS